MSRVSFPVSVSFTLLSLPFFYCLTYLFVKVYSHLVTDVPMETNTILNLPPSSLEKGFY